MDLTIFSMVSGDWKPIHSDAEHARQAPYGQRIVNGVLGNVIVTGMFDRLGIFVETGAGVRAIEGTLTLRPARP